MHTSSGQRLIRALQWLMLAATMACTGLFLLSDSVRAAESAGLPVGVAGTMDRISASLTRSEYGAIILAQFALIVFLQVLRERSGRFHREEARRQQEAHRAEWVRLESEGREERRKQAETHTVATRELAGELRQLREMLLQQNVRLESERREEMRKLAETHTEAAREMTDEFRQLREMFIQGRARGEWTPGPGRPS